MGAYYKLVNRKTKERIEPGAIGGGGIKFQPIILGPTSRLLMWLNLNKSGDWIVISDEAWTDPVHADLYYESAWPDHPNYFEDVTEQYRKEFNECFGLEATDP